MKAAFLVPPNVHLLDLTGAAQVFYEATEYGISIDLVFLAISPFHATVKSSAHLSFSHLTPFSEVELASGDFIFIPGLEMPIIQSHDFKNKIQAFLQWLVLQREKGVELVSICTGAFLLAEAGLLHQKQVTTHWKFIDLLQQQYPKVQVLRNRLFVENDGIYTSAGVASGIDLALYLLEKRYGTKLATEVAREVVVYFRRGEQDPQLSIFLQYRNHLEDRIHELQDYISHHLDEAISIENLAARAYLSPRHLTRLFKDTLGITIGQYMEKLKVEKALQLLEDKHKMDYIAYQCGFKSTNQLRQILRKHSLLNV